VSEDLEAALERVETPIAHRISFEPDGLLSRLYGWSPGHRVVPTTAAIALALGRGALEWRLMPSRRRLAVEQATTLLGGSSEAAAVRHLSRAWLRERTAQTEMSWRPWASRKIPVDGFDPLMQTIGAGGGAIVTSLHFGAMLSFHQAMAQAGLKVYVSGGHAPTGDKPIAGHEGRWVKTQNVWIEQLGHRWVRRGGSYVVLGELLRRGATCWMAWDTPGDTPAHLLGRPVRVRSGIASLAIDSSAPVFPELTYRDGLGFRCVVGEPLVAREGETPAELTVRIGDQLSRMAGPMVEQTHPQVARLIRRGEAVA